MKLTLALLILVSFLILGNLSILAMGHDRWHDFSNCLALSIKGEICPGKTNPLAFAAFHLEAFKFFSTAVFSQIELMAMANFIILLLTVILLLTAGFYSSFASGQLALTLLTKKFSQLAPYSAVENLISYLSLQENSPSPFGRIS